MKTSALAIFAALFAVGGVPTTAAQTFQIRVTDADGEPVEGVQVGVYSDKASYQPKTTGPRGQVRFDLQGPITRIMAVDPSDDYAPSVKEIRHSASTYEVQLRDTFGQEEAETMMNSLLEAVSSALDLAELSGQVQAPGPAGVPGVFSVSVGVEDGEPVLVVSGTLAEELYSLLPGGYTYRGRTVTV